MVVVIVLSVLSSMGTDGTWSNQDTENSTLSYIGKAIVPAFRPMGVTEDNWPATVGLFTGIFAKEAVVGTLNSLYAQAERRESVIKAEEENVFDFWDGVKDSFAAIPDGFSDIGQSLSDPLGVQGAGRDVGSVSPKMVEYFGSKAAAFAYLLFVLIYSPCVAAIAAIYRETNWRWATFSVVYLTVLAWLVATAFYQVATFFDHPGSSALWLLLLAGVLVVTYAGLKSRSKTVESV